MLHQNGCRKAECQIQSLNQLLTVLCLADAHAGAQIDGLDDDGVTEGLFDSGQNLLFVFDVLGLQEALAVQHGDAGILEDQLHHVLIHAHSGRQNVTAGKGNAQSSQVALQGAVFHIGAVNDGQHHIDDGVVLLAEAELDGVVCHDHLAVFVGQNDLTALLQQAVNVLVGFDVAHLLAGVHLALLGDVDGNDLVLFLVQMFHSLQGGDHRDLMLHTLAAEHDRNINFHVFLSFQKVFRENRLKIIGQIVFQQNDLFFSFAVNAVSAV